MNKTLKKVLSLAAASAMSLTLAVTTVSPFVYADNATTDDNATINIIGNNQTVSDGSTFSAYRLLNVTQNKDDTTKLHYYIDNKATNYNANVTAIKAGLAACNVTVNDTITDDQLVTLITSNIKDSNIVTFGKAVYKSLKHSNGSADYTSTDGTFTVTKGYYLIAENIKKHDEQSDSESLILIDTAAKDTWTVTLKKDVPSFEKKIKETDDSENLKDSTGKDTGSNVSGWQDAADYDIGDTISFQLRGTLPDNYGKYSSYYFQFADTPTNLTYKALTRVYVDKNSNYQFDTGDIDVTKNFTYAKTENGFTITDSDLKKNNATDVTYSDNDTIVAEYTATLASTANIGSTGNPNVAHLVFSNNPNYIGTGNTSPTDNTPDDKVTVFTYEIVANKVHKNENNELVPLSGAGFTLSKYDLGQKKYVQVGSEITGKTTFEWKGTDAGLYKLEETTVPEGYSKAADVYFKVNASYDINSKDPKLTSLTVTDKDGKVLTGVTFNAHYSGDDDGKVVTSIENTSTSKLPSTGGIGTTIFYVCGGSLVAIAAALLISKKRASAE